MSTPLDLLLIKEFTGGVNMPSKEQVGYVPVAELQADGSMNYRYAPTSEFNGSSFARAGTGAVVRTPLQRANSDEVHVSDFMTQAQLDEAMNGTFVTDMAPAIQAAIDWGIYRGSASRVGTAKVIMPPGKFRINTSLHLGYGTNFTSVIFEGQGAKVSVLFPFFSDRPCIVVHGGRNTCIRDLGMEGKNQQHIVTLLNTITGAAVSDSAWVDPTLHANAASQWAPYAGVAIDPFCGPPAAQQYPAVSYPAFLGTVAQYNKNFSSQTRLENVDISGFVVGVLNQVGDATGNGDYTKLTKCSITYCQYGLSICNTQARLTEVEGGTIVVCHTAIVTAKHGRQNGKPSLKVSGCELGVLIKFCDIPNTSTGGGPQFDYCYGEGVYSIGNIGSASSNSNSVTFNNCEFALELSGIGSPAYTLKYDGTGICTFDSCTFKGQSGRISFFGVNGAKSFRWIGNNNFTEFDTTALYQKFALNATGGVTFVGSDNRGISTDLIDFSMRVTNAYNLTTGSSIGSAVYSRRNTGNRNRLICAYTEMVCADDRDAGFPMRIPGSSVSKAALVFVTAGRDVTVTLTGRTTAQFALQGPDVGDVVWDEISGVIFYVRSRTGTEIIMRAQNGYNSAGNLLLAMTTAGSLWFLNTRRYTPAFVTRGTTTAGSAVMTAVQRDDGDSTYLEEEIDPADFFYIDDRIDRYLPIANPGVASVSEAGPTITADANFIRSETRKRLELFIRAAAPNA